MKNCHRKTFNIYTLNSANYKERQFFCVSPWKSYPSPTIFYTSAARDLWQIPRFRSFMVYCGSRRYDMIWQCDDPHMTTWQNDDPHINGTMAISRYAYEYHPWCISGRVIKRSGADKHFELAAHCDVFEICLLIFGALLKAYAGLQNYIQYNFPWWSWCHKKTLKAHCFFIVLASKAGDTRSRA